MKSAVTVSQEGIGRKGDNVLGSVGGQQRLHEQGELLQHLNDLEVEGAKVLSER